MNGRLDFDATVRCSDGEAGSLVGAVVDEDTRRLTHLVVRMSSRHARLVPLDLVESAAGHEVVLACTTKELAELVEAHGSTYVEWGEEPKIGDGFHVGVEDVTAVAYPDLGELGGYVGEIDSSVVLTYDRIPDGCVEIRGASAVFFADGRHLGHVAAWALHDDAPEEIVLAHGHLLGARQVSIPLRDVAKFDNDVVTISLTVEELEALPSVHTHHLPFG